MVPLFFLSADFQSCALHNREADQVPSSNPDSPHQSLDRCSFDSDGELCFYDQAKMAAGSCVKSKEGNSKTLRATSHGKLSLLTTCLFFSFRFSFFCVQLVFAIKTFPNNVP